MSRRNPYRFRRRSFWEWLCDIDWFTVVGWTLTILFCVGLVGGVTAYTRWVSEYVNTGIAVCNDRGGFPIVGPNHYVHCLNEGAKK